MSPLFQPPQGSGASGDAAPRPRKRRSRSGAAAASTRKAGQDDASAARASAAGQEHMAAAEAHHAAAAGNAPSHHMSYEDVCARGSQGPMGLTAPGAGPAPPCVLTGPRLALPGPGLDVRPTARLWRHAAVRTGRRGNGPPALDHTHGHAVTRVRERGTRMGRGNNPDGRRRLE